MEKLQFTTTIKAPKKKVWNVLWDDETYPLWTSVFSEGSKAVTDWNEGSKVLFLDKKGDGMVSMIDKKIPDEFMSFKHLGEYKGGKELPMDKNTEMWAGAKENYELKEKAGETTLMVELDSVEEFKDYFSTAFPKALKKVKEISEK